jgi:hypothetical protein
VAGLHAGAFLLPLILWMGVIWIRYDTRTLAGWVFTQVVFVVRHSTDLTLPLSGLPTLPGWGFRPAWGADNFFLAYPLSATLPFLAPIAIGLMLLGCRLMLAVLGVLALSARERRVLIAGGAVVALFVIWFLAFDPTQWGRHLLPAVYVAIGLGLYSTTTIVTQAGVWSGTAKAIAVAICIGVALCRRTPSHAPAVTCWPRSAWWPVRSVHFNRSSRTSAPTSAATSTTSASSTSARVS